MFFQIAKKGNTHWLLYIAGFIIIMLVSQTLGAFPLIIALLFQGALNPENIPNDPFDFDTSYLFNSGIDNNLMLFLMLIPFLVGLVCLFFVVKFFHGRGFLSTVTARMRFDKSRLLWGAFIWICVSAFFFIVDYQMHPEEYITQFNPLRFGILVIIVLLLIPFQCAFEEIMFRGYLMQGIGVATGSRWFALLVTSVVFGLMHVLNPEVAQLGFFTIVPLYILLGLLFGIIAIMDNGLEIPIGLHAANNIFTALVLTADGSVLQTDAIFKAKELTMGSIDYFGFLIPAIIILAFFSLKYKWGSFQKLFEPIPVSPIIESEND